MSKLRMRLPRVYPTWRFAAAVAAGSLWFFAVPWLGSMSMVLGGGYLLLVLALAALELSWVKDSRRCSVERVAETILSIGEANPIFLEVIHRGKRSLKVQIRDEAPGDFEVNPRIVSLKVSPGQNKKVSYKVTPFERGDYFFGNTFARYYGPLGLVMRQEIVPAQMAVKVYPDVLQTKKLLELAKQNRIALMGLRKSRQLGHGQEFERLRDYVPDDSLRYVDWKATARRGSLITREYDVEQSQNIMILIDLGRTMASRTAESDGIAGMTKADLAINASVLLTHVAAQSDDRVGLFCFADAPISFVAPGKGDSQAAVLMDSLYALHARTAESNYIDNIRLLSERHRKRSMIFLFTDLIDPESSRMLIKSLSLLTKKHLVICVALADYELKEIIENRPEKPADMYSQAVALNIVRERNKAMAQLQRMGVVTIDATPSNLSVTTVNKYLQLKREARL